MPDQYKDMVLRDAFLNGLKDSFQNVLLKKKIAKLEDAYREAQVLESMSSDGISNCNDEQHQATRQLGEKQEGRL